MRISAQELTRSFDCRFYACTKEAEVDGYCKPHKEFLDAKPDYDPVADADDVFEEPRCQGFIKSRGLWEGQVRCSFPATRGDPPQFCGRHDPASMDIRKSQQYAPVPRAEMVAAAAKELAESGVAVVECGKDIDARQVLYEAAKKADLVATTSKVGPGRIEARVIMGGPVKSEEYFEGAVA